MNIKKIIREEVENFDNLDWIRNIPSVGSYRISSEPNLYIDDAVVQILDLPDFNFSRRGEKDLGTFKWTRSGMSYRFKAVIHPITYEGGNKMWRVIGTSGDSGFGYSWITKRNTLGKRARMQIFKQIIDKYNLDRLT
jgi:hypothetical protein